MFQPSFHGVGIGMVSKFQKAFANNYMKFQNLHRKIMFGNL